MRRVVFVTPTNSHPRYNRRINAFLEEGYQVVVYSYARPYHHLNPLPSRARVTEMGLLQDGQYMSRIPKMLRGIGKVRRTESTEAVSPDMYYAFGLDSAIIALAARPRVSRLVYEIGDLRNVRPGRSVFRHAALAAERHVLKAADAIVVTSKAFAEEHYEDVLPGVSSRIVVLENKLAPEIAHTAPPPPENWLSNDRIRIGFVGSIRYPQCLIPMLEEVERRSDVYEMIVHGDGPGREAVERIAERAENISYMGPFRNPDDLPRIYGGLDLNFVVYDNSDPNVRLALPNKLYESLYFGIPLVVASRTALASKVEEARGGFVVDPSEPAFARRFLDGLSRPDLIAARTGALAAPHTALVESPGEAVDELLRIIEGDR